jgi:hypothetical protein
MNALRQTRKKRRSFGVNISAHVRARESTVLQVMDGDLPGRESAKTLIKF